MREGQSAATLSQSAPVVLLLSLHDIVIYFTAAPGCWHWRHLLPLTDCCTGMYPEEWLWTTKLIGTTTEQQQQQQQHCWKTTTTNRVHSCMHARNHKTCKEKKARCFWNFVCCVPFVHPRLAHMLATSRRRRQWVGLLHHHYHHVGLS